MKALWTEDEASFKGELVGLEPSWAWPKPAQRPHPPIIMGAAAGPKTIADMVEFCDGWMPLATRMDIVGEVGRVRQAVTEAGRDPASFEIIAYGAKPDHADMLTEAGVDHTIFNLRPLGPDERWGTWTGWPGIYRLPEVPYDIYVAYRYKEANSFHLVS